jgi:uncharacterized membrane protein YkoI
MRKRNAVAAALATAAVLAAGSTAVAGGTGLIFDDGNYVQPGQLDDGRDLQSQATISTADAVSGAQTAASGALGQVDLVQSGGRLVYVVDVGSNEVSVDATDGSVVGVQPQS